MSISATKLRQNLYNILDQVINDGIPVEVERKGHKLKIVPEKSRSKFSLLEKHEIINGDPESFVHIDWTGIWNGEKEL